MRHTFTPEQLAFLRNHVVGRTKNELTDLFNEHFGLHISYKQIRACCKNHKFPPSGLDGRFKPGHIPFNKGEKGTGYGGWKATQFKKGHKPYNHKPVGSERVNGDDYVDIKIAEPNIWKAKHVLIWEEEHGTVPDGHVVIFGDTNRRNFNLDNLILISRKQLALLNKHRLIQKDTDLTKTAILVTDLISKIGERKRERKS